MGVETFLRNLIIYAHLLIYERIPCHASLNFYFECVFETKLVNLILDNDNFMKLFL